MIHATEVGDSAQLFAKWNWLEIDAAGGAAVFGNGGREVIAQPEHRADSGLKLSEDSAVTAVPARS